MGLVVLDRSGAREVALVTLGLPAESDDVEDVLLAAALRRAASFLCPAKPSRIVRSVVDSVRVVDLDPATLAERTGAMLELVVGYGDLVEVATEAEGSLLYLRPPGFLARTSGSCFLTGVRPDGADLVGDHLAPLVEHQAHVRRIRASAAPDVVGSLLDYGLQQISDAQWLRSPRRRTSADEIRVRTEQLGAVGPAGQVPGLTILDSDSPTTYYRGRWRSPDARTTGCYVARRPRSYGADLWCYVDLQAGQPLRVLDLPTESDLSRGCDEAWRLQAAIDAAGGRPQVVRYVQVGGAEVRFEVLSPLPSWLQRRWDLLGTVGRAPGCLFTYTFDAVEAAQEQAYAEDMMWLRFIAPDSEGKGGR